MLYLTEENVQQLLPMSEAIRLMREAFTELANQKAANHPRRRLMPPDSASVLHYMVASFGPYFGTKIYSTNAKHGAHFYFLLYKAEDGAPLAMLEANLLGQIRTGAVSGLATDLMAKPGSVNIGLIGSGFQAESQLQAVRTVRQVRSVKIWSRNADKRTQFAEQNGAEPVATAETAVSSADVVITATNSKDPVLEAGWIAPGAHVNAMGSNQAKRRELPPELLERASRVVVDAMDAARLESGDLLLAWGEENWPEKVCELSQIVTGRVPGRTRPDEITIFKSNGLAVEDVAVAGFVYEQALAKGQGLAMPHS
jgi:ornithine cyclodeaminase/alanine dehydrogenase-like protein (mu-crystallin family)